MSKSSANSAIGIINTLTHSGAAVSLLCPLCNTSSDQAFFTDLKAAWPYHHCFACDLIYRSPETFLPPEEEKTRYSQHQNLDDEPGYLAFLDPVRKIVLEKFPVKSSGIDFGCGPNPVLANTLKRAGYQMSHYDPYFAEDNELLKSTYDFVVCTEACEHFYKPNVSFALMRGLLRANGSLILMTRFHQGPELFADWWYRKDPTHVCFYSIKTLAWLAKTWNASLIHDSRSVATLSL